MDNESREILNRSFGGSIFATAERAAIACLIDNLTVGGSHDFETALEVADWNGKEFAINEIVENFSFDEDQKQALVWAWQDAIEKLSESA